MAAAVLHLEAPPGMAGELAGAKRGKSLCRRETPHPNQRQTLPGRFRQPRRQPEFFLISPDGLHSGQGSRFLRGALGVAAGDPNGGPGIDPVQAADDLPGLPVGPGRHRAGVHQDEVRERARGGGIPPLGLKLLGQSGGIVLVHLAAEGDDAIGRHF
jgi:hypothetical protein